jgi:uncharacterized protein (DUF433 family)
MSNMKTLRKTDHPHIVRDPHVCGGEPIVEGSRITVSCLVLWHLKYSYSPEELQQLYSHLNLAQIHDALAYYYDHQAEIDEIIRVQEAEDTWKTRFPTKFATRMKSVR